MPFKFTTLNDARDPTFNQLLSINDPGTIAGYFGSGAKHHPNKGYTLKPHYGQGQYTDENVPNSAQTQVTGINDADLTVGFWADAQGDNFAFVDNNGRFKTVIDPTASHAAGGMTSEQFLGVNNHDQAAGFYVDGAGNSHGFIYDMPTNKFSTVSIQGAQSVTATGINDKGAIAGFFEKGGKTEGFIDAGGHITVLAGPHGASDVQALGLNDHGQVVGSYVGAGGKTNGFVYGSGTGVYTTVDDPNANGSTIVNGINNAGEMVGFYTDAAGNTDGMLVVPHAMASSHLLRG